MVSPEEIYDLLFDNMKHLFFPENWLQLDLKFSKTEIFSMFLIDKNNEITMTELSDYLGAPMSTSNGIIERLVKKRLVVRDRSESDRRVVVVRLTEEGAGLISGFKELITGYLRTVLKELSEEEVQSMLGIITKIFHSLQSKLDRSSEAESPPVRKITID